MAEDWQEKIKNPTEEDHILNAANACDTLRNAEKGFILIHVDEDGVGVSQALKNCGKIEALAIIETLDEIKERLTPPMSQEATELMDLLKAMLTKEDND